jgi:3-hydroxyisobutyrate dehydrogenase-like beta-hydroxyacid dehydrogenase
VSLNPSHDVAVIGLGAMGSALARALLDAGKNVIVWNRSHDKTEALAQAGADVASSPSEAVRSSPVTLICLWDYPAADQILAGADIDQVIAGRVIVQLSTGNAEEATRQAGWLEGRGAAYLAGGIMCYPRAVGAEDTISLYSGNRAVFDEHAELLAVLAPGQRHVGDLPGDVAMLYTAVWGFYFAAMGGLFDGLALTDSVGLSRRGVKEMVRPMASKIVEGALDVIDRLESANFAGDQATVAGHVDGLEATSAQMRGLGLEPRMLDAFIDQLKVAADRGRGGEDIAAVAECLLPAGRGIDGHVER